MSTHLEKNSTDKAVKVFVIFLAMLLLTGAAASILYAHDKTWNISYNYSGESPSPIDLPYDPNNPLILSVELPVTASGVIEIKSPTGVVQTLNIANIDDTGFSDYFIMDEIGVYEFKEKYSLTVKEAALIYVTRVFQRTDTWYYDNSAPSAMLFTLEDMYVGNYSTLLDSDFLEVVLPITPDPCRPGSSIILRVKIIADIHIGDNVLESLALSAEWHKSSSITPMADTENPVIRHNRVTSIQAGDSIEAKVTDNLKVDSVTLYFKDASSGSFQQIDMALTDQPDIYAGIVPFNAAEGNGQYYIVARDMSGNESRTPLSSHTIFVDGLNFGDVNDDGVVNNDDALMVLQAVIGAIELTPDEQILADVSGNGIVGALDAAYILQYAAGLITIFPVQSGGSGTLGIIASSAVELSVPDSEGQPGDSITIPINITDTTGITDPSGMGIIGVDIILTYDPAILTATGISTTGTMASGWYTDHNVTSGQIIIVMARTTALTGAGTLVNVNFNVSAAASHDETSPVAISSVSLNEGGVSADTVDGVFTVNEEYEIGIPLYEGWNPISIPVEMENTARSSVLASIESLCQSVWEYSANPGWKRHVYDGPPELNDLENIVHGKGYWLNMNSATTLTVIGRKLANDDIPISLFPGRNLVGYNSLDPQSPQDALSGMPAGASIQTYDNLTGTWLTYVIGALPLFNNLPLLEPGKGYWLYTPTAFEWIISP